MLTMASYAETGRSPRTLTEREHKLLLEVTGEHRNGYWNHVLISLALGTGLREHELLALDCGDVFDDDGRASGNSRQRMPGGVRTVMRGIG